MKIKLQSVRFQNPVFFSQGKMYSSMSDDFVGGPAVDLEYDEEDQMLKARDRKNGLTVLVPVDNIASMNPKEQGAPDAVQLRPDAGRIAEKKSTTFQDTRLEQSAKEAPTLVKKGKKK